MLSDAHTKGILFALSMARPFSTPVPKKMRKGRPVYQCTIEGKPIKKWEQGSLAAAELGVTPAAISVACRKGGTCKGYRWSYVDEVETFPDEEWRPIPGTKYQASSRGRIRYPSGKITEGSLVNGYPNVLFNSRLVPVHRLVAWAFLGREDRRILHIDGNKTNNAIDNLRYA